MGNISQNKWPWLMTLANGIMCVLCSFMISSSSFMLYIVDDGNGSKKNLSLVMSLSVKDESFLVGLPLNSHGGSPCNDAIVAITQNLKCNQENNAKQT